MNLRKMYIRKAALAEGKIQGAEEKALESAENLLRKGIPIETRSECIGLPLDAEGFIRGMETKSVEIAKAMLADGTDINLITKYTGLSVEKLKTES